MNYDTAHKLADEIRASEEYKAYTEAREAIQNNPATMTLLKEYHKLQIEVQSQAYTSKRDDEAIRRLQKLGELLQMNEAASRYLIAEYKIHTAIGDIYKIIAEAADIDLSALED